MSDKPPWLQGDDFIELGDKKFGPDGTRTGECGICYGQFGHAPVAQLNGVLVHVSCYSMAMKMLRALTICWRDRPSAYELEDAKP